MLARQDEFLEFDDLHVAERKPDVQVLPRKLHRPLDLHHAGQNGYFREVSLEIGQIFRHAQAQYGAAGVQSFAKNFRRQNRMIPFPHAASEGFSNLFADPHLRPHENYHQHIG